MDANSEKTRRRQYPYSLHVMIIIYLLTRKGDSTRQIVYTADFIRAGLDLGSIAAALSSPGSVSFPEQRLVIESRLGFREREPILPILGNTS